MSLFKEKLISPLPRLALVVCALTTATVAWGQTAYPSKPVRLIVPFPPGGPNDLMSRILALHMSKQVRQQVIVDNRSGASGIIGAEFAANAPPDGYTLFFGGSGVLAVNPSVRTTLPYDPVKSFAPISLLGSAPSIVVVHPSLPVKNVRNLIDLAKAKPGELTFGADSGAPPHLAGELFKYMAKIDLLHVPYKGGGPVMADLIAGHISLYFSGISVALPHVNTGKLRAIAVTSAKRSPVVPALPTVAETLPGFEFGTWFAMLAPAKTPPAIVNELHGAVVKVLAADEVKTRYGELGIDTFSSTPAELTAFIRTEIDKMANLAKVARLKF